MSSVTADLLDEYDVDDELIEALLVEVGVDLDGMAVPMDDSVPEGLGGDEALVYAFLQTGENRTAEDHYYQLAEYSEWADDPDLPPSEDAFRTTLEGLVDAGLIACVPDDPPLYSGRFDEVLYDLGPDFTAAEIDRLCADSGMDKRAVYRHVLTDRHLSVDVTR